MKLPRKLTLVFTISLLILSSLFLVSKKIIFPALAFSGSGLGTSISPFQITSCSQFQEINNNDSASYIIMNNFSCSGVSNWSGLNTFSGVLDGNGKTISDFTGSNVQGIFIGLSGATVKNLTIANVNFSSSGNDYVGVLSGSSGNLTIENVHVTSGSIAGATNVGGLIGNVESGNITDSSSAVSVSGVNFVGGLVGRFVGSTIEGSFATGNVSSTGNPTGGLVGYCSGAISNSYATGNVLENNPTASDQWGTGGLAGFVSGGVTNSYATGKVDSYWEAGGLVGWAENTSISTSYATGNVGSIISTGTRIGGFIGAGLTNISNCFATGSVTGNDSVGGFAGGFGWGGKTLSYSYSKGAVTGSTNVGGFVGDIEGTVNNSYYDQETSGHSDTGKGIPTSTSAMKTQSTYSEWDFSTIWNINGAVNGGYPINYVSSVPDNNAKVTSSSYTVSTGGTTSETITGVPFGTSKSSFLAAIAKGDAAQTWNTTGINDPVVSNNTLVVTAENGTTVVTYTITVDAELNHDASLTSSVYTISLVDETNATIAGVSLHTTKSDFLAALTEGNSSQEWNSNDLSDPVQYNEKLIVTAEDGTTVITYTIIAPPYSGSGEGTEEAPYQVTNCLQLQEIQSHLSSYFVLNNDIDCSVTSTWNSGKGFEPIGNSGKNSFVGTLDGNGHTISALTINHDNANDQNVGLFGVLGDNSYVLNLNLADVDINSTNGTSIGALAGSFGICDNNGIINIEGYGEIGNVHILSGQVSGYEKVGGLVGTACYYLYQSSSSVSVTGNYLSTGGLAGENCGEIWNSYSDGNVTGNENVGGLVGLDYGNILDSYATGNVVSNYIGGGLIGNVLAYSNTTVFILQNYATGRVTGDDLIGGLIGQSISFLNPGQDTTYIRNNYATGDVVENDEYRDGNGIAGLVGRFANGSIQDSYSVSRIDSGSPESTSGGLVGMYETTYTNISNSFWNTETSGYSIGTAGTGKTNAQMKTLSTYTDANWDFSNIWKIDSTLNNGFPFLSFLGKGNGTSASPYEINSCGLFQSIKYNLTASYILTGDIDCSGYNWIPIGTSPNNAFMGNLNGNNHKISNIDISTTDNGRYMGIFSSVENATIKNIKLENITIDATEYDVVGGLAGSAGSKLGKAVIENISLSGSIKGRGATGGILGYMNGSPANNLSSSASVYGYGDVGGLIGAATVDVTNSYASGDVYSQGENTGGLLGFSSGKVTRSYALGSVTSSAANAGGLIGFANGGDVQYCYAEGNIISIDSSVGGLIGWTYSKVLDSFANGNVTGNDVVGGLIGLGNGNVTNSYSTGKVTSVGSTKGGLIGDNTGVVTKSFYNLNSSTQNDSGKGVGKTTAEMANILTYSGWNFTDVWTLPKITITASPSLGGNVVLNGDNIKTPYFRYQTKQVSISATALSGYTFVNWSEGNNVLTTNGTYAFQVGSDRTFIANFHKNIIPIIIPIINNTGDTVEEVPNPPVDETPQPENTQPEDTNTTPETNVNTQDSTATPVAQVFKTISTQTKAIAGVLSANVSTVSKKVVKNVQALPISDEASKNITEATLAIIAVSPAITVGVGGSYTVSYLLRLFSAMLSFVGLGRKKRNCGLVYDSVTKEPLGNAIVRIYGIDNTLIATEVTNTFGIFETFIESGKYKIKVQAVGYKFPSSLILGNQDFPYNNIYVGDDFYYDQNSSVSYSIPVDPVNQSKLEYAEAIVKTKLVQWVSLLLNIVMGVGLVFSIISYIKLSNNYNLALLIVYITLTLLSLIIRKQEKYRFGRVMNLDGTVVGGVQIGLMDTEFNTLFAKRISSANGKYRFIVPKGEYSIVSLDPEYQISVPQGFKTVNKSNRAISISKNILVRRE